MSSMPRIIVLGLDGVPYTLIQSYIDKGLMPNLKSIVEKGSIHQMDTVLPEVSASAWSSFMTGKNPAKTNIYGFFDMKKDSYSYMFTNFLSLKEPPIWNLINREIRKSSVVINMPLTYPAQPMKGALISGFVSPVLDKSVYPQSLLSVLKKMSYEVDLNLMQIAGDKEMLLHKAIEMLDKREKLLNLLWKQLDWQLFTCVITGTDRIHHFLMDAFNNDKHPLNSLFEEYYKRVDSFIGRLNSRLEENDRFILLSDHGFEVTKYEVNLNVLFKQLGWLEDVGNEKKSLENITENTRVFALDPARIYINSSNRYPRGIKMTDEEQKTLLERVISELNKLVSPDGEKVINAIHRKEDIYSGSYLQYAPDLVLVANEGFSFKATIEPSEVFVKPSRHTGHHNSHDAFLACNFKMQPEEKPSILDLAPTILNEMQIDISKYDFDGKTIAILT